MTLQANERMADPRARIAVPAPPPEGSSELEAEAALPWGLDYARLDYVTHINIYSRGVSQVGRMLSHFAFSPFTHPQYGPFNSMEGFWYYFRAADGCAGLDRLRVLSGRNAKYYGKQLPMQKRNRFKDAIIEANFHKVMQNPELRVLVTESTLPFDHYYLFEPQVPEGAAVPPPVFIRPPGFGWLVRGFEQIRKELKKAVLEEREPLWERVPREAHLQS